MKIATADLESTLGIAVVQIRSWQAAYVDVFEPAWLAALSVESRAKRWHEIIAAKGSHNVVSKHDGHITGFVSFGKCRDDGAAADRGEIFALYVDPDRWRFGCGRALLKHAVAQLQADGFNATSLWVLCANHQGIRFYEACGFERVVGSEKIFEMGGRQIEEVAFVHRHER